MNMKTNVEMAALASKGLSAGMRIGEPVGDGRWRVLYRGTVLNSAQTLVSAIFLARQYRGY
jgi:hypothetical protein